MFTFIYRFIKHLSILLFLSIPLQLVSVLVLICIVPFTTKASGISLLPKYLKWFDNADYYVGRDYTAYTAVCESGWKARYIYLVWTNPTNYFGYVVLGFKISQSITFTESNQPISTLQTTPVGDTTNPGYMHIEYNIDNSVRYEYYYIKAYKIFGQERCFRMRIGHKLGLPTEMNIGDQIEQVFVISPFHSYTGTV